MCSSSASCSRRNGSVGRMVSPLVAGAGRPHRNRPKLSGPPCGYLSRLAALLDDPEVLVFPDHLFNARFNVVGCVPGRDSEALRSRADLLPFLPGQLYADAAPIRQHSHRTPPPERHREPVVLAPVEVPQKTVLRDAPSRDTLYPTARRLRGPSPDPDRGQGGSPCSRASSRHGPYAATPLAPLALPRPCSIASVTTFSPATSRSSTSGR